MNKTTYLEQALHVLMMPDYRADNPYQSLLTQALEQEKVAVDFPSGYRRVFPIFRAMKDCQHSIDVLHLHWLGPYIKGDRWLIKFFYSIKFLIDVWLIRLSGIRVVWTVHNRLSHEARFPRLELWTVRQLVKLVDAIIVHHRTALTELSKLYQFNPAKAAVIPHGHYRAAYDKAIASSEARAILGLPVDGKIYLNLGMLRPYKGIERLLLTWRNYPEVAANHTLLIAGKPLNDTYGRSLTEQVAEIKGAILHLGFIEDHLIPIYFSAADVVILPFENVLTSGSLLLAMSYSKPIIAPRSPEIAETLGSATDLLYDEDPAGLAKAIQKSLEIDLTTLEQQVGRECDRLNWESIAAKTCQIYWNDVHAPRTCCSVSPSVRNELSG